MRNRLKRIKIGKKHATVNIKKQLAKYRRLSSMVLQNEAFIVKKDFTKQEYRSFYLRRSIWEAICVGHGWHGRGSISRFAESLGITRQYASMIVGGKAGCSAFVMRKIVNLMNLNGSCWCFMFEQSRCDDVDTRHPIFNAAKENGEIPYEYASDSAKMRNLDYKTEKKNIQNKC